MNAQKVATLYLFTTANVMHVKRKAANMFSNLLKKVKANSSKWINSHQKIIGRFAWQVGYGVFSVSESRLRQVLEYVANQKKHHHRKSFKEEFFQLLDIGNQFLKTMRDVKVHEALVFLLLFF